MNVLEVSNGKVIAEIPGKYATRVVCRLDSVVTGNLGITKIKESGWPIVMNTRKYSSDMRKVKSETTQQLRREVEARA